MIDVRPFVPPSSSSLGHSESRSESYLTDVTSDVNTRHAVESSLLFSLSPMRLSIAMLLAAVIAAPRLQALHTIDVAQPHTPPLPSTNPLEQSPLSMLRRPSPEDSDNTYVRDVSAHTYGELELFAKYASAAYQYLCPRPLGNTLVRSVSCARLTFVGLFAHYLTWDVCCSSPIYYGFVPRAVRQREIVVAYWECLELVDMVTGKFGFPILPAFFCLLYSISSRHFSP